jgi:hypothetical protein
MQKQIQRPKVKRAEVEIDELPTAPASDTSDVADLLTLIAEVLDESR